jgi:hypothetical protein
MKNRLINELARLASEKYQNDFIRNASKHNYVLPDELIDTVRGTISVTLANGILSDSLSSQQIAALQEFDKVAATTSAYLAENNNCSAAEILELPAWINLRSAAKECLSRFGVSPTDWESFTIR